jgi:hypothetical protein
MKPARNEAEILADLDKTALEIAQITLYLEGSLQKSAKRYVKKDGSVSVYELPPVLQYPKEHGQGRMRIPARHLALVRELLEEGKRRRKLLERHRALSLELAKVRMRGGDAEKKNDRPPPALPALAAPCIASLRELFAAADLAAVTPERLDADILARVREFGAAVLSALLTRLGEAGDGHVRFRCRYCAPDPGPPVSRQDRRRREREAKKGRRRKKNGDFARVGGASGAYPLRDAMGLFEGMTPGLAAMHRRVATLAGSFREGAQVLREISGVPTSESTFMRRAYAAGRLALLEQALCVMRLAAGGKLPAHLAAALVATPDTLYIMLDGTGVPCVARDTRGRKGKDGLPAKTRELKVGVVGVFRHADARGRPVRNPHAETHVVSAKGAKDFGVLLRRMANSRGYGKEGLRVQICGDGAEWIERIVRDAFPGAEIVFVNDFYHASEHLHDFLSHALSKGKALSRAYAKARGILRRNGAQGLLVHLQRLYAATAESVPAAKKELDYFRKRVAHMDYPRFRKQNLYIGSGIVEAACRTDVARRCKQAGMHWRLCNAEAMCALVARMRSGVPANNPAA